MRACTRPPVLKLPCAPGWLATSWSLLSSTAAQGCQKALPKPFSRNLPADQKPRQADRAWDWRLHAGLRERTGGMRSPGHATLAGLNSAWSCLWKSWKQRLMKPASPTALIIDDEIQIRRLLRAALEGAGY